MRLATGRRMSTRYRKFTGSAVSSIRRSISRIEIPAHITAALVPHGCFTGMWNLNRAAPVVADTRRRAMVHGVFRRFKGWLLFEPSINRNCATCNWELPDAPGSRASSTDNFGPANCRYRVPAPNWSPLTKSRRPGGVFHRPAVEVRGSALCTKARGCRAR